VSKDDKKDPPKLDPAEVAKLPTYVPPETPYDKATKNPAPQDPHVKNGPWGGLE
jgi:hypothetical protein